MDETVGLVSGSWCKRNQGLSNNFEVHHYSIILKYLLYMPEGSGRNVIIPGSFTLDCSKFTFPPFTISDLYNSIGTEQSF